MMAVRKSRRYTVDERTAAVARALEVGQTAASIELGIPKGTLSCWASKARSEKAAKGEPTGGPTGTGSIKAAEVESEAIGEAVASDGSPSRPQRRVAKRYTPSQRAEFLEYAATYGPAETARKFGVSRWSLREWQRKVRLAAGGKGDSPTSGPDTAGIEAQRDQEILNEWHRHPGLGPSQIKNQLRRTGIKTSVSTVRRVMEEAGYRPPKRRSRPHDERFEAVRPNHRWALDFLQRYINRTSTFTLLVIDDHSRFVVGHGVDDAERADMVIETFSSAVMRYGKPEMVLHDKGSAFWSWRGISRFTALLTELDIEQIPAEHKEWNGKIEVFNANIQKEFFDAHRFYDLAEMKRRLAGHLYWYNHRRTHHALGGLLVPADRYYGRVEEVLARIEAGAGSDIHTDLIDLRDRVLELFKVTSTGGKAEVWLMGQRLFGPGA